MKLVRHLVLLFLPLLLGAGLAAAEQLWTCGMHPQIIKKEPGNCPVCGMKLTPIRANASKPGSSERKIKLYKSTMMPGEVKPSPGKDSMGMDMVPVYEGQDTSAQNSIQIDAATIQRMNLKTALVGHGPVRREIRTVGTVAYNEQGLHDITTKYEGWIEKLHINTTWAVVKAGVPLFEVYSPDLYNAQLNYVLALRSEGTDGGPLTRASLARLQLFDMPADFIEELKRSGEAQRTVVFRAPSDGVVIEKMAVAGQMMKPGERIYRLADLSSVWVLAQVYEKDLPFLHEDQAAIVRTSYGPERKFEGRVQVLLPQVQEETRATTARIVLPNPDRFLRPGMFVEVSFASQLADDAVLVPDMAVLRSGERNTVFVALDGGYFEPREVQLGARSEGGNYQILSGLTAGERVVTSGQFMLDSESQLREAIQKMLKPVETVPSAVLPEQKPMTDATPAPAAPAQGLFATLAGIGADASAALAADDLAAFNGQLPALRKALATYFSGYEHAAHGPLVPFKDGLTDSADLAAARSAFAPFSTALANLALEGGLTGKGALHVFYCSMVDARWLQRGTETQNPFYGAKMLTCGEEVPAPTHQSASESPKSATSAMLANLPPGHPPIAGMSVASYLQSLSSEKPAGTGSEACGSCGMSKVAMAAGEPCATDHQASASKL